MLVFFLSFRAFFERPSLKVESVLGPVESKPIHQWIYRQANSFVGHKSAHQPQD